MRVAPARFAFRLSCVSCVVIYVYRICYTRCAVRHAATCAGTLTRLPTVRSIYIYRITLRPRPAKDQPDQTGVVSNGSTDCGSSRGSRLHVFCWHGTALASKRSSAERSRLLPSAVPKNASSKATPQPWSMPWLRAGARSRDPSRCQATPLFLWWSSYDPTRARTRAATTAKAASQAVRNRRRSRRCTAAGGTGTPLARAPSNRLPLRARQPRRVER